MAASNSQSNHSDDDATDSFLGYLYQLRFGLLVGLRLRDPQEVVAIEMMDDVSLVTPTTSTASLFQLKHSLVKKASLSARSMEVWKTLGNWATKVTQGEVSLPDISLFLHTTGRVSSDSPLSYLKIHNRDERKALEKLRDAASTSNSTSLRHHSARFLNLTRRQQFELIERITVVDETANVIEAAAEVEQLLAISSRPETLITHRQHLEGWFFDRVIRGMSDDSSRQITAQEIRNYSTVIRDQLVQDRLPGLDDVIVPESEVLDEDTRCFVRQLRLINVHHGKVRRAQIEHFQALTQRSRWSRDELLAVAELPKFDSRLVAEWEIRHENACRNSEGSDDACEIREANAVYSWIEQYAPSSSQLFIRQSFTEPYLIRGSYHMLADRRLVGWHPRFASLLPHDPS